MIEGNKINYMMKDPLEFYKLVKVITCYNI